MQLHFFFLHFFLYFRTLSGKYVKVLFLHFGALFCLCHLHLFYRGFLRLWKKYCVYEKATGKKTRRKTKNTLRCTFFLHFLQCIFWGRPVHFSHQGSHIRNVASSPLSVMGADQRLIACGHCRILFFCHTNFFVTQGSHIRNVARHYQQDGTLVFGLLRAGLSAYLWHEKSTGDR